jgi:hypothetical protein
VVGQNNPALVALRSRREMVIDALSTHFANEVLDMDEFEQCVDLAHRCTTVAELDELLRDLGPAAEMVLVQQVEAAQVAIATRGHRAKRALSVLSSILRKGTWRVPKKLPVVTVMGAVEWDPDAPLLRIAGVAVMGSLDISKRLPEAMIQVESSAIA